MKQLNINNIGKIVSGGTPSTKNPDYYNGEIPWITPADLSGYRQKYIGFGRRNISEEGLKKSSAKIIPAGSILFSSRAPIGYVAIAENNLCTNQGFKNLILNKDIFNDYVYYYLKSAKDLIDKYASGTTFKEISAKAFGNIPIPLPPLETQHLIVKKIESLFSELDRGLEALNKAKEQVKLYRQSVLKSAFEGKLTEDWRKKNGITGTSSNGLPPGWNEKPISSISKVNPRLPFQDIKDDLEVTFLPMRNVQELTGDFNLTGTRKYEEVKKGYTPFIDGDFIFAKITPCMENGKMAVVNNLVNGIGFGSTEFLVIRCSSDVLSTYLFYYFNQDGFRAKAKHNMTGAVGQKRVPKKYIESYVVPLAPIEEQNEIVSEVKNKFNLAKQLEEEINKSIKQSENLRQSILKKAFNGELV